MGGKQSSKRNTVASVEIDLESARPLKKDETLYDNMSLFLQAGPVFIKGFEEYESRAEYIRKAMGEANEENEDLAFRMVSENVVDISRVFKASRVLVSMIPEAFGAIAATDDEKTPVLVSAVDQFRGLP